MPKIGHGIVEELPLSLPPLDEQARVAEVLEAVDRKCEAENSRAVAMKQLFASLLGELMTGRRRVDVLEAPRA
jgi:type I restriction enzyme S subunit